MVKISAVIITYNEEDNLTECLDSLKNLVDEIVIVDSFSTDKTEELSRAASAKFIQNPFGGHIEQKNFAMWQAQSDYILSLDADERVSENLAKSILKVKNNWTEGGYNVERQTYYGKKLIKYGTWAGEKRIRLFDRRLGKWQGTNPHDSFKLDDGKKPMLLQGPLYHYRYKSIQEHINQVNFFSDISSNAVFEKGGKTRLVNMFLKPAWRFFRDYFIKMGFLGGWVGFVSCYINSWESFLKHAKLLELQKANKKTK